MNNYENVKLQEKAEKHDILNPKLFKDNKLKPEVRSKILEIVDDFLSDLEDNEIAIKVKDIEGVGSNFSYNYGEFSDIDIHIISSTDELECPYNLFPLLYSSYRSLWKKKRDVSIYGIPVELYVETDDAKRNSEEIAKEEEQELKESLNKVSKMLSEARQFKWFAISDNDAQEYYTKEEMLKDLHTFGNEEVKCYKIPKGMTRQDVSSEDLIGVYKNGKKIREALEEAKKETVLVSNGIYSVLNDKWIKEPVQADIPDIDEEAFEKEFKKWEDRYFDIIEGEKIDEKYRWKPSRTKAREFVQKMKEIDDFCNQNNIRQSASSDSYYFTLNGKNYRVSNHSVERSHYKDDFGNSYNYHGDSKEYRKDIICINAGKTRIIDIYNNLKAGKKLDGNGNVIYESLKTDFAEDLLKECGNEVYHATYKDQLESIKKNGLENFWFGIDANECIEMIEYNHDKLEDEIIIEIPTNKMDANKCDFTMDVGDGYSDDWAGTGFYRGTIEYDDLKIWDVDVEDYIKESLKEDLTPEEEKKVEEIEDFIEDIYDLRKQGINKEGEYSIPNLVFKELRNLGYLDNLKELKGKLISKKLSLESLNESKEDIARFINKFGQDTYNLFRKSTQRLKNHNISTDILYHVKNTESKDLKNILFNLETRQSTKDLTKSEVEGKYKFLGEKNGYLVYEPLDAVASMNLSVNTGWCTGGRYGHYGDRTFKPSVEDAESHWNEYTSKGVRFFYFLDSKTREGKYAIALYPEILKIDRIFSKYYIKKTNIEVYNAEDELDYSIIKQLPIDLIKEKIVLDYEECLESNGCILSKDRKTMLEIQNIEITSINIPNSVTSIGDYAFSFCSSLTSIYISNNVTSIGRYVFAYCSSLESIDIPNSVISIGDYAFYRCSSLTTLKTQKGSYAEMYFKENYPKVKIEYINTNESLKEDISLVSQQNKLYQYFKECIDVLNQNYFDIDINTIELKINDKTTTFGSMQCKKSPEGKYTLYLSKYLENESEENIKNVIYHELCHYLQFRECLEKDIWAFVRGKLKWTEGGKFQKSYYNGHGTLWKKLADEVGRITNQKITRLGQFTMHTDVGNAYEKKVKNRIEYEITCKNCGNTFRYRVKTDFVKDPNKKNISGNYRWICSKCKQGGHFEVKEVEHNEKQY